MACIARDGSLATFLMLRVASGAFAGASPVVKAYLADAASPEQLPSFMARPSPLPPSPFTGDSAKAWCLLIHAEASHVF